MKKSPIDFADKTVLEVGCGRGDTTRELVRHIATHPGASLIAADKSSRFFSQLRTEFAGLPVKFICTDACELVGIENDSIDWLVCNYTLCAVNAQIGLALLALTRFFQVLKEGGDLTIEEEFPIETASSPAQKVWAKKWRILKSAYLITQELPYTEFAPEVLAEHCTQAGFSDIQWRGETQFIPGGGCLDFFQARLDRLQPSLPNQSLKKGYIQWADQLRLEAEQAGGMEIPYYRLVAKKPARSEP